MSKIIIKIEYQGQIHKLAKFPESFSQLLLSVQQTFKSKLPDRYKVY